MHRRQHADAVARRRAQGMVRLHEEFGHRRIAPADRRAGMDPAGLGEIADLVPERDAGDVDRLDGAPEPHDVEIVEALIVDVVRLWLTGRLALRADEIEILEDERYAEIGLGALADLLEQRDLGAEHAQGRPPVEMERRGAARFGLVGVLAHEVGRTVVT